MSHTDCTIECFDPVFHMSANFWNLHGFDHLFLDHLLWFYGSDSTTLFILKFQVNHIIDELNKIIRINRIRDGQWRTFAEQNKVPYIGERCFCLEKRTRKWLRALVDTFDTSDNVCKIRYLDTGFLEPNVSLDNLLQWKDFELSQSLSFQAVQCALNDFNREDFKKFLHETKYYFKDYIYNRKFKCKLKEKIQSVYSCSNSDCWLIELYDIGTTDSQIADNDDNVESSIIKLNDKINEKNMESYLNSTTNSFASQDIRLTESKSMNIIHIATTVSYRNDNNNNNNNDDEVDGDDDAKKSYRLHTQCTDNITDVDLNGDHEKTSDDHTDNIVVKSSMSNEHVPLLEHKTIEDEINDVLNSILDNVELNADVVCVDRLPSSPLHTNESMMTASQSKNYMGHYLSLTNVYDSDADDQTDDKRLCQDRQGQSHQSQHLAKS
jgi:hypothetical protein